LKNLQDVFFLQTNGSGVLSFAGVSASAGQVIQVLSATDSTVRTTTSTSFVTGSNTLSVTITPSSASNKILILTHTTAYFNIDGGQSYYTIYRGSTNLGNGNSGMSVYEFNASPTRTSMAITYLDSPATTSATTYQVYFRSDYGGGIAYLNLFNIKASITVMEIKG